MIDILRFTVTVPLHRTAAKRAGRNRREKSNVKLGFRRKRDDFDIINIVMIDIKKICDKMNHGRSLLCEYEILAKKSYHKGFFYETHQKLKWCEIAHTKV